MQFEKEYQRASRRAYKRMPLTACDLSAQAPAELDAARASCELLKRPGGDASGHLEGRVRRALVFSWLGLSVPSQTPQVRLACDADTFITVFPSGFHPEHAHP